MDGERQRIGESDSGFSSSYWGFQMVCGWSSCSNFGGIFLNSIELIATEDQGPGLTAVGSDNLWYQSSGWVWNPPGDPWSVELSGSDPSGVCQMWAVINGVQINSPAQTPDTAVWQQCPDWTWPATVDTTDYVPTSGPLALTLGGTNAAGVASAPSETLHVDNQPVQLSVSGPSTASTTERHAVHHRERHCRPERRGDRLFGRRQPRALAERKHRGDAGGRGGKPCRLLPGSQRRRRPAGPVRLLRHA